MPFSCPYSNTLSEKCKPSFRKNKVEIHSGQMYIIGDQEKSIHDNERSNMNCRKLKNYAELIVNKGLNLDRGQEVLILASLDQPDFVRNVVELCYKAGASRVLVQWKDDPVEKLHLTYRSEKALSRLDSWELARLKWRTRKLPALLWLDSDDPDAMDGIDQGKRARAQMARFPKIKPFRDAMEGKYQWCIAGIPGEKWAKKVFPGLPARKAVEKLWDAILTASRAKDGNPCKNWEEHNRIIRERAEKLNSFRFDFLEYKAKNGTDFRVGLIPEAQFLGGAETDRSGRVFNPNIPSEEIFTSPMRGRAEGTLVSTKPLSWQGTLIEDFSISFHEGKVSQLHARKGEEALKRMIAMDEGASYLGEIALIPWDSPINNSGILFYNTLYDENACCHVALGRGFENCMRDYEKFSLDEIHRKGINDSMIHVDFMVGAPDLQIDGITRTGEKIAVFRKGNWAI